jgi:hypothetical protein
MRILPFLLCAIEHDAAAGHKRNGVADAGGSQPCRMAGQPGGFAQAGLNAFGGKFLAD